MSTIAEKQKERMEVRNDYLAGKKPKRVFVATGISCEAACGFAGVDLKKAHYDYSLIEQALDKVSAAFPSDVIMGRNLRSAYVCQLLESRNWKMGSRGTLQHPEVNSMMVEDYDEFIRDPYKTMVEKFMPRLYAALEHDSVTGGISFMSAHEAWKKYNTAHNEIAAKINDKYGYVPSFVTNSGFVAQFDFLADQLRGFTQITMDIHRIPDKVKAAVDAIVPLMLKKTIPQVMRPGLISFVPFHMGSFIGKKAFAELYWPSFEKCVLELEKIGIACCIFVEHDWTRHCSYLERLPKSTIMYMEQGDPQVFSDTVGREHIIGGFYDPTISLTRSKQECIDAAKKLLDITMKTGKYYFCFDKNIMDIKSIDVSKVQAVLEWVYENAKY